MIIEYKCTECGDKVKAKNASKKMKEKLICEKCLIENVIGADNIWKSKTKK